MVLTIASVSPYIYTATVFFSLSVFSSDLLVIRICLTTAFFFLLLAGASGHDPSGSFGDSPFKSGVVDPTWLVNVVLFCVHMAVCARLLQDEVPRKLSSPDEEAMYRFFSARCGVTKLEFQAMYRFGNWLDVESGASIPHCNRRLYLVLDGKMSCHALLHGKWTAPFMKRSGQFFDMKLFNFFSLPVGFDNTGFVAEAQTPARLFYWEAESLKAMASSTSPILTPYWEFCVVRSLAGLAIQHHLKKTDTLYDSLFVPEDPEWLEGARSRDFSFSGREESAMGRLRRSFTKFIGDCKVIAASKAGIQQIEHCLLFKFPGSSMRHECNWIGNVCGLASAMSQSRFVRGRFDCLLLLHLRQVLPPRGIRHRPRLVVENPNSEKITEDEMPQIQPAEKQAGQLQEVSVEQGGNEHNTSSSSSSSRTRVLPHDCFPSRPSSQQQSDSAVVASGEVELS